MLSNRFWYGFAIGAGAVFLLVIVLGLIFRAFGKSKKDL